MRKKSQTQKQPLKGVLKKRCFENMQQIYRRTPMSKCDFNKVALQLLCILIITPSPPPPSLYERSLWDYKNTNIQLLNRTIETFTTGRNYLKIRTLMSSYSSSRRPCLIFFIISFQIRT